MKTAATSSVSLAFEQSGSTSTLNAKVGCWPPDSTVFDFHACAQSAEC